MRNLLAGCFVVLAAVCGEVASAGEWLYNDEGRYVYRTYRDSDGNSISRAQYDADKADHELKKSLPSSRVDKNGTVWFYRDELEASRSGSTYRTENNSGTSYRTTNNYGTSYGTENNYGTANRTINNYGRSNITINNYGTGRTTVNDSSSSRTTVNRRRRR